MNPGLLSQSGLCVDGSHTEKRNDPHPEDGAGAADQDRTAAANNGAGTHLRRNGGCQCLKGAHAAFVLAAVQRQISEHVLQSFSQTAHLHKAGFDRIPEAYCHQQEHQHIVRKICIDRLYNL